MAKVPFTKLKCKLNIEEIPVQIGEETIAVKQYLPIQEKLVLIGDVVMQAHEQDENYSNPIKAEVYRDLEVVFAYTNISFTDKQKEDLPKLYDLLASSGILKTVIEAIPEDEYAKICMGVWQTIESIYKYQNSVLGVLDTVKADYSDTEFDLSKMQEALGSSDLTLIKDIVSKLG